MSNIKLDLKRFKHIKSDKHSTTLQHPDGHTITMAHSALGPEAKQQLMALSHIAKDAQTDANSDELKHKMAKGGKISEDQAYRPPKKGPTVSHEGTKVKIEKPRESFGEIKMKYAEGGQAHQCEGSKYCHECGKPMQRYAEGTDQVQVPDDIRFAQEEAQKDNQVPIQQEQSQSGSPSMWEDIKSIPGRLLNTAEAPAFYGKAADMANKVTGGLFNPIAPHATPPAMRPGVDVPTTTLTAKEEQQPASQVDQSNMGAPTLDKMNPASEAPPKPTEQEYKAPKTDMTSDFRENKNLDEAFKVPEMPKDFDQMRQEAATDHQKEMFDWANDLHNGHITPKTYSSLFHDKGVVGKIGTIFSLMLGGMGGALTGTPNAGLAMMDKVISNDLEAQKQSKTNAQNFLRLSQEHEYQKAQEKLIGSQGPLNRAQAANLKVQTDAIAWNMAKARAYQTALQAAVDAAKKYPNDPRAQQHLAMMATAVQGKTQDLNAETSAQEALLNFSMGKGNQNDPEAAFQQQQMMRRMQGQGELANSAEQHHIAGIASPTSQPVDETTRKELGSMNMVNRKGQEILDLMHNHPQWKDPTNQKQRAMVAQKVDEFKNFYNTSIGGGAFTEGRIKWYDDQFKKDPSGIAGVIMANPEKFAEAVSSNNDRLEQRLSGPGGLGLPKGSARAFGIPQTGQQPQQQAAPQQNPPPEGMKRIMYKGNSYLVPNK